MSLGWLPSLLVAIFVFLLQFLIFSVRARVRRDWLSPFFCGGGIEPHFTRTQLEPFAHAFGKLEGTAHLMRNSRGECIFASKQNLRSAVLDVVIFAWRIPA